MYACKVFNVSTFSSNTSEMAQELDILSDILSAVQLLNLTRTPPTKRGGGKKVSFGAVIQFSKFQTPLYFKQDLSRKCSAWK